MTTPPPHGQNPYAQTPPPPVGQQPGQPGVPPQGAPYAPFPQQAGPAGPGVPVPPPAPLPPAKKGGKKALRIIGGVLVAILIALVKFGAFAGLGWFTSRDDAETTSVGSCMHNKGTNSDPDLEEVDCSSADAQYKVVQKHNFSSDTSKCTDPSAPIAYWQSGGGHDVVLCMSEVKK
ncbi:MULTISPECIES: hypothetical protein [unclassified Streptomyces]|uniref:LppU/SCO3897 family protein n=1 Tax=unclassified Streptomyces TaxID=2593676 RepID=UPI0036FFC61F